ncbi:MAG: 2TM domain-containing protein [Polaromonas sp.]|uniref:2TM domain-containing protein n=1 Tax=Polaromonas sp. TaxID=1869339 RepID=UPI002728F3C9|nr:2TM domain-containing protein [Polaromonas sp.]MDO9112662.1 2TM domain-containing protein [Polaromonas sp.]MDP1888293.1 2TM domain-containing protein [Polaromonas sp.]MDP3249315.1 2TM domain-containing protein [Polaromonas sp.]MDP3614203.1 2TM domain-containing protein [Rubrivivax sp.]
MKATTPQDKNLEHLARKRAGAKIGWYIHATVFIAVNLMLLAMSALSGRHWAVYPAFGWGIGLAVHGAVVFLVAGGAGLHERLVQRERERLSLQRDPW